MFFRLLKEPWTDREKLKEVNLSIANFLTDMITDRYYSCVDLIKKRTQNWRDLDPALYQEGFWNMKFLSGLEFSADLVETHLKWLQWEREHEISWWFNHVYTPKANTNALVEDAFLVSIDGRSSRALSTPAWPLEQHILDTIGSATFAAELMDDTIGLYGMSGNDRDVLHEQRIIRSGDTDSGYATMILQVSGAENWKVRYWRHDTIMQVDYVHTGFKERFKGILQTWNTGSKGERVLHFYLHNARFKPDYEVLKPVYDGSRLRIIVPVVSMQGRLASETSGIFSKVGGANLAGLDVSDAQRERAKLKIVDYLRWCKSKNIKESKDAHIQYVMENFLNDEIEAPLEEQREQKEQQLLSEFVEEHDVPADLSESFPPEQFHIKPKPKKKDKKSRKSKKAKDEEKKMDPDEEQQQERSSGV